MSGSIARIITSAAFVALAGTGLMKGEEHATFHLPMAAHWGSVLLAPGDYSLSLPDLSIGDVALRVAGAGRTVYEMPSVIDRKETSNKSRLELWNIDGNYFIRELAYGPTGKTFTFFVPKPSHRVQIARIESSSPANSSN